VIEKAQQCAHHADAQTAWSPLMVYSTYPILLVHFDPQLLSFILIKSDRPLPLQETR